MKTVYLHGELGKKFRSKWLLDVESLPEIIRAIDSNEEGFLNFLVEKISEGVHFSFMSKDVDYVNSSNNPEKYIYCGDFESGSTLLDEEIHICPCAHGATVFIPAAVAFVTSKAFFQAVIFAVISYGIAELTKPPDPPKVDNKTISTKSYILNGPNNVASQGVAVPIGYGRLKIGGVNIGVEREIRYKQTTENKLESYTFIKYLELLCEGPIEGLVDESGAVIRDTSPEDFAKATFLNDTVVKNSSGSLNYILTEENNDDQVKYVKGLSQNKILQEDGVCYIRAYDAILHGTPPFITNEGTSSNPHDLSKFFDGSPAAPTAEWIDYAIHGEFGKGGESRIISHSVYNSEVNQVTMAFKAELSFTNVYVDEDANKSVQQTKSNFVDFIILVERDGVEYNLLSDESGCYHESLPDNSGLSVGSAEHVSKAEFGKNKWDQMSEEEKNLRSNEPIELDLSAENLPELGKFLLMSSESRQQIIDLSYENFVDKNIDILYEYEDTLPKANHFRLQGIATSAFEFSIKINIDWDKFGDMSVDKNRGITFKVARISPELNPTSEGQYGGIHSVKNLQLTYIQERVGTKLSYPHSAVIQTTLDSRNFSNAPSRAFHVKMKKILLPSNYDPVSKKYLGPWNGLFSGQTNSSQSIFSIDDSHKKWSDNPAWIFFDIITNPRFGVAKYGINSSNVDKWQLYKIAKYCDELVETEYPIETKSKLPRAFSTDNIIKDDLNKPQGYMEIQIEKYFWYSDEFGTIKMMNKNFADPDYVPDSLSRQDLLSDANIDIVFLDLLGRVSTQEEKDQFLGTSYFTVEQLMVILFRQEEFEAPLFSELDFIKEFGDGDSFKGKKVAFFMHKHGFNTVSDEAKVKIQGDSCSINSSREIEERILIKSDPSQKKIFVSGPSFSDNSSSLGGSSYGGCALQINHPTVEPRFSCDVYINDKTNALNMLNSMSSIFRGIVSYHSGKVSPIQDGPKKPIQIFNNSNVSEKGFSYVGGAKSEKYTSSVVRFNNKEKNFKPDIIYEEDVKGIQRIGFLEKETIGIGVTSPSQARRLARWNLITSNLENDTIRFEAALEGNLLAPGLIFEVFDEMRLSKNRSGRIIDIEMNKVGQKYNPCIALDKDLSASPSFSRVEISIAVGRGQSTYESIDSKSQYEKSELDQDEEISNMRAAQVLKFDCHILPRSRQGGKQKVGELRLKKGISISVSNNTINCMNHGFVEDDRVVFLSSGVLPSGLKKHNIRELAYFVKNPTDHTFQVSEVNSSSVVRIVDEGRDGLLNKGGFHYVSKELQVGEFLNDETLEAIDQLSVGATYLINGLNFLEEEPSQNIPLTQAELARIGISSNKEIRKKDWVYSEDFGLVFVLNKDYIFETNLGWIYIRQCLEAVEGSARWFFITDIGWIMIGPNNHWYFLFYEGHASISPWAYVRKENDSTSQFFIYTSDTASVVNLDHVYLGGSSISPEGRKVPVSRVNSGEGYWVDLSSTSTSEFNPDDSLNVIQEELSAEEEQGNSAIYQMSISNFEAVQAADSVQNKNSIRVELEFYHDLDIIRNLSLTIKEVVSSDDPSDFQQGINKKWSTIYVDSNTVELIDSEAEYQSLNLESLSSLGIVKCVKDSQIINQSEESSKLYRVVSCKENSSNNFDIIGSEYNLNKFEAIDKRHIVRQPSVSIPPQANMSIPEPPENLILSDLTQR